MKFYTLLALFAALAVTAFTGCKTTCDDCTRVPAVVKAAVPKATPVPVKVQATSLKAPVTADLPKCEVITEYWGSSTYLKLTDINGHTYKLTRPVAGMSNRYTTRTGWYLIDSNGEILKYQDKRKVRR